MLKLVNTFEIDEIELYIEQVLVKQWVNHLLGKVAELDYGYGPSSIPIALTYGCKAYKNEEECEAQEGDDQSEGAEEVQDDVHGVFEFMGEEENNVNVVSSFLVVHEAMESEQGRYVSLDGEGCDVSNNPNLEDQMKFSLVQYHSAPSLQFENVENIGNVVSSDRTPWENTNIGNIVGQVFIQKQIYNILQSCTLLVHTKSTLLFYRPKSS